MLNSYVVIATMMCVSYRVVWKEECRRVRGLLREAESRCRGLQDEVEESQARERRITEDAEDARRRAAAEAGQSFPSRVWGLRGSLWPEFLHRI